jgi:hypothetical protein
MASEKKNVIIVTFPRSGHSLLARILRSYLGKDFHYCRFYTHCRQIPCSDPKTYLQKNHDFGLALKISPGQSYIVQYRNPLEALVSYYEFRIEQGQQKTDSYKSWVALAGKDILYWKGFIQKWVINRKGPYFYHLSYEDLIQNPIAKMGEVIKFVDPSKPAEPELVCRAVRKHKVRIPRNIKDFKYYNPRFFKKLERIVREELDALGYAFRH